MKYVTSGWLRLKNDTGLDRDFARHLRGFERPVQIAFVRIMTACAGNPVGLELRHKDRACWAFVLPNVYGPDAWRSQYFDAFAFSRHACFGSMEETLEALVREGYWIPDPGALDRAAAGEAWQQGLAWTDKVRAMSASCLVAHGDAS